MKRLMIGALSVVVCLVMQVAGASAQAPYEFKLGFKLLADQIPAVVGQPLENEHHNPENGDSLQRTTTGLMVWRKADNWTAFTNGHTSWINGPRGVQSRLNTQRFEWEGGEQPMDRTQSVPAEPTPPAQVEVQVDMGVRVTAALVCSGQVLEYPFNSFRNVPFPRPSRAGCSEWVAVQNVTQSTAINVTLSDYWLYPDSQEKVSHWRDPFTLGPLRSSSWDVMGGMAVGLMAYFDQTSGLATLNAQTFRRGYFVTWQWQHPDGSLSSEMRSPLFLTHTSGY